jgi:tetratricopeptide (TPR) repeat protein
MTKTSVSAERSPISRMMLQLNAAHDASPLAPTILTFAAVGWNIAGRFVEAECLARRALALEPDHLTALSVCGQALSCLGRHEEAIALLERAVGLSRGLAFVGPQDLAV